MIEIVSQGQKLHIFRSDPTVKEKQNLGEIEYWLNGNMLKKVELVTEFGVPKQNIFSGLRIIIYGITLEIYLYMFRKNFGNNFFWKQLFASYFHID